MRLILPSRHLAPVRYVRMPRAEPSKYAGGTYVRAFPDIVDAATWNEAQATMTAYIRTGGPKGAKRNYLLRAGRSSCEGCGMIYVGQGTVDNRGKYRAYYAMGRGRRARRSSVTVSTRN